MSAIVSHSGSDRLGGRALRRVSVGALALVLVVPASASATVSVSPDTTVKLGTGGAVYGMAHAGDTTYIGGTFASVGQQPRANVAAIGADGKLDADFNPGVNGKVMAVAVSTDGATVYLGGTFTDAGGAARANLAAVDADTGQAVATWQADTAGMAPNVTSLAVHGDRLYVGGRFTGIDGTSRKRLVAVTASTGEVVTGFKPAPDKGVTEVVVSPDGATVYAGGAFTTIGGQPRLAAGSVNAADGSATSFAPSGVGGNAVTIGLSPNGSRFFYGTENNTLFSYEPAISNDPVWSLKTSGNTQAITVSHDEMWIGGHFSQIVTGKIARPYIASLNPVDGSVNEWNPGCFGGKMGVWALVRESNHLHVGGLFSGFGATKQRGYACFTDVG